jgi:hypothetical protein
MGGIGDRGGGEESMESLTLAAGSGGSDRNQPATAEQDDGLRYTRRRDPGGLPVTRRSGGRAARRPGAPRGVASLRGPTTDDSRGTKPWWWLSTDGGAHGDALGAAAGCSRAAVRRGSASPFIGARETAGRGPL